MDDKQSKPSKKYDAVSSTDTDESTSEPSFKSGQKMPAKMTLGKRVNIIDKNYDGEDKAGSEADANTFTVENISNRDLFEKLMNSRRYSRILHSKKFRLNWEEFVRTVKVHEMLKCLESEHRKLKILRQHAEDVLVQQAEGEQGNRDLKKKFAKRGSRDSINQDDFDEDIVSDEGLDDIETENELRRGKEDGDETMRLSAGTSTLSEQMKKVDVLTKNRNITDEEFEEIVALCEDRAEQKALRETFAEKRMRDKYLHNASERRRMTYDFINGQTFKRFMLCTIIISTAGITLLTFEAISLHYLFPIMLLDACVMGVFVVEAALKISIYREDYFRRMWNILDMIIVLVHFAEITVDLVTKTLALNADINASIAFKFLKSLRALRLLRIIKFLPNLQVIVSTIFQSFLSLGSIAVLMCLFIFVFAVMGKGLFSEDSPKEFGTLWNAIVTLFQLLTLDDWSTLLKEIEKKNLPEQYWMMFFYLFLYILIEYFVFLNLFVAVLVDNFQLSLDEAEVKQESDDLKRYEGSKAELAMDLENKDEKLPVATEVQQDGEGENEDEDEGEGEGETDINEGQPEGKNRRNVNINSSEKPVFVKQEVKYELPVDDYYAVPPGSRESEFMENILKNMTAVDYQRFVWRRRLTVLNNILDEATLTRANTFLKAKKQAEEEQELQDEDSDETFGDDDYVKKMRKEEVRQAASVQKLG